MSDRIGEVSGAFGPLAFGATALTPLRSRNTETWSGIMSVISYRLLTVYRRLDDEIRIQVSRRWPDVAKIQRLKKLKLAVKDRLHRLATGRPSLRTA